MSQADCVHSTPPIVTSSLSTPAANPERTPGLLPRRSFLRGLVTLPLVGGALSLSGQPTAAAVPVTEALLHRYVAFLVREHASALNELEAAQAASLGHMTGVERAHGRPWHMAPLGWFPEDATAHAAVLGAMPSARAAVVLSAAGCELTGGARG